MFLFQVDEPIPDLLSAPPLPELGFRSQLGVDLVEHLLADPAKLWLRWVQEAALWVAVKTLFVVF